MSEVEEETNVPEPRVHSVTDPTRMDETIDATDVKSWQPRLTNAHGKAVTPGLGHHDAAAGAFDQLGSEFSLQLLQLQAERALADVAVFRRPTEMADASDGYQIFQIPEVHAVDENSMICFINQ